MKNLKTLLILAITGSMCGMDVKDTSDDRLKSFRIMVNNCDKPNFTRAKTEHFNEHDYRTITVNQMIDTLNVSIGDLKHKKNEFPDRWCGDCQYILNLSEDFLKDLNATQIQIGGNHSIIQHNIYKNTKEILRSAAPILKDILLYPPKEKLTPQQKQEELKLLSEIMITNGHLTKKFQPREFVSQYSNKS